MQKPLVATALVMLLAVASATAQAAATAEPMDIDPSVLSKMALERAKARNQSRLSDNGGASSGLDGSNPTDCGSVNIGNVMTGGRPGFAPHDITVVITGDVINANNKCNK